VRDKRAGQISERVTFPEIPPFSLQHTMPLRNALATHSAEDNIILAIRALKANQFPSIRRAAEAFNVPKSTLIARLSGRASRQECTANSMKLSTVEEEVLLQKILDLNNRGFPPTLATITDMANLISQLRDGKGVGVRWAHNFVKRSQQLKTCLSRKIGYQRGKNEDPETIQNWFTLVQNMINFHSITPYDIYNFDETGFRMGQSGQSIVVTSSERKQRPKTLGSDTTEWVTVTQGVNAQGWSLPPYLIFKAKDFNTSWFQDLPSGWKIGVSPNGWTSNEHGLEWIKHFHQHTIQKTIGVKRLLVLDGHDSHLTSEFQEFCSQHNIITLCMPPHSSHLLQPLDVGCFGPLKKAYQHQMQQLISHQYFHITKEDFIPEFQAAFRRSFTQSNIQGGFRGSGLFPLDSQAVLSKLTLTIRTPSPPLPSYPTSAWESQTPSNPHEIDYQTSLITDRILHHPTSSPTETIQALQSMAKGFHRHATESALLRAEVGQFNKVINSLQGRKSRPRKRFSATGALTAQDYQCLIDQPQVDTQLINDIVRSIPQSSECLERKRKCGLCKQEGHNRLTCPLKSLPLDIPSL